MKSISGRIAIITMLLMVGAGCSSAAGGRTLMGKVETFKKELLQVDSEFSRMAQEKGVGPAFIHYAAEDVVLMRQQQLPIIGKAALTDVYSKAGGGATLTWRPRKSDASVSGDLGFTFGSWESTAKDKEGKEVKGYGVYITVWKRQADGTWKYVFDGGNNTPPWPTRD